MLNHQERIEQLRRYGIEDGIRINPESEQGLRRFMSCQPARNEPTVFLMDQGQLRAIWEHDGRPEDQLALLFRSREEAHYVIFHDHPEEARVYRKQGTAHLEEIPRLIRENRLEELVYAAVAG